jgi:hypothetical protein
MSWELTDYSGTPRLPNLPDRAAVEALLSPATKRAWGKYEALAGALADKAAERARVEGIELVEAEQRDHEALVQAVRQDQPVGRPLLVGETRTARRR